MVEIKTKIILDGKTILVTGAAGFIGGYLVQQLLSENIKCQIIGLDNLNDYYDVGLKQYRLEQIEKKKEYSHSSFVFIRGDISDKETVKKIFKTYQPAIVVNLAAQAGVRYSINNPDAYINSNIIGFYNVLEACRHSYEDGRTGVEHLVYASSSSVYGGNTKIPFEETDLVDAPVSLYAATKKSNELLAYCYAKLYDIPSTGLRFFTVYGPAGRPDMAYFGFADKLRHHENIQVYNYGNCRRDFTYVGDIVVGIEKVMRGAPKRMAGEDGLPVAPHCVYNIGNSKPENLLEFIQILSEELIKAGVLETDFDLKKYENLVPMQPGDVPVTYASTEKLENDYGYRPTTGLREGLRKFAGWYKAYYK